ncbi:MAG TPA: hypothetical protein VFE47_16185 [Tepidisphaeraceae bacterium]|jgi:hypothetical protein|nr:hypothetical protein [Tepidisphaeraceae bacterium]
MSKPLVLNIPTDLEQRLNEAALRRGLSVPDYAVELLQHQLPGTDRRADAVATLQAWVDEGVKSDQTGSDDFLRALDEDRPSERKLFPPELKGITW